jgi:hypothetical protein
LDRFSLSALDENEDVIATAEVQDGSYDTLPLPPNTAFLRIDTGDRKDGQSQVLLCNFAGNCP